MYIGHIRKNDNKIQSVSEHNLNTAFLANKLCFLDELKEVAFLAGILHDAGKYTEEFKNYIIKASHDKSLVIRGSVIHSSAGARIITDLVGTTSVMKSFTAEIIREAIISHHGLYDCVTPDGIISYNKRMEKNLPIELICNEFFKDVSKAVLEKKIEKAVEELSLITSRIISFCEKEGNNRLGSKHFYIGMCVRLLMSSLIDADRTDTYCFMNNKDLPKIKNSEELGQYWKEHSQVLEEKLNDLSGDGEINKYRKEISAACLAAAEKKSGILRLVIPTGGGKTLSSLRYAVNHAKIYKKNRIIYIAPYNSILEQNAQVIRNMLGANADILEHHSNIVKETQGEYSEYQVLTSNWNSSVILTTAVQFLNTLFSSKPSSVQRMHSLANAVIVVDEIQAFPIKCTGLFNLAINYLTEFCESSVVLCSATQPLLDKIDKNSLVPPTDMIGGVGKYLEAFKRTVIIDKTNEINGGYNIDSLANFALERLEVVNSLLIIVNTKTCANNLFQQFNELMKDKTECIKLFHLSTSMCPAHRRFIIKYIKRCLRRGEKIVCVSTQLIEAGVDISFHEVIRSFSGLDSIIQAAGRCNRNGENKIGNVYIVKITDENISNLPDIMIAQNAMDSLLLLYKENSGMFDDDLFSKKAMDIYYNIYFYNRKSEMDYRVPQLDTTIVDLLSINRIGTNNLTEKSALILKQAFKTAGEHFEVITDKGKTDIVVDYCSKSHRLLEKMNSNLTQDEQWIIEKKLQLYSVSISDSLKNRLKDAIIPLRNGDMLLLRSEYYSKETGVGVTASEMKYLQF